MIYVYLYLCRTTASEPSQQYLGPGETQGSYQFPSFLRGISQEAHYGKRKDEQRYFSSVAHSRTNHNTTTSHREIPTWKHI